MSSAGLGSCGWDGRLRRMAWQWRHRMQPLLPLLALGADVCWMLLTALLLPPFASSPDLTTPPPLPSPAAPSSPVAAPRRYHYNVSNHRLDVHVSKGFDDGLYISSVCACGDLWAIIMDAGTGFSQQVGCTAWGGLAGCARYRQSKYGCSQLAAFLPGWPWHGSRGPLFF